MVFIDRPDTAFLFGCERIAELNLLKVQKATPQVSKPHAAQQTSPNLENLLEELKDLFDNSNLPPIHGFKAHLPVKPDAQNRLFKAMFVPYSLRSKIETESKRLEKLDIISKVAAAEFSTTPNVPVLKPNGQVRICKDFKVTVNRYLDLTQYSLPHIEEIFERLSGRTVYSKLDRPVAYRQVELDEESKRHVIITTHKGLYFYYRLCFGIASVPAIFQGIIEQILQPIKEVQPYLDDITLKGINDRDHLQVLRHTFSTLRQAGVKLKREKCVFM